MKKSKVFITAILGLSLVTALVLTGCPAPEKVPPRLEVVTGTSLIADIVEDIGGDKVAVSNIIPGGLCPGHYDVRPGDIRMLAEGGVFLIHHWQQGHEHIKGMISAAKTKNPDLIIKVIEVKGNWMAPPFQAEAVEKIAAALSEVDPANSAYFQARSEQRRQAILAKGEEIQAKLEAAGVNQVKVICSKRQAGFVKWAGFEVVATYGRPEGFTPAKVAEIVAEARAARVALVIDNLQSGPEAGKVMAQDIGAIQVTISNFPGGFEQTETWEKAIDKNVELLLEALAEYRR